MIWSLKKHGALELICMVSWSSTLKEAFSLELQAKPMGWELKNMFLPGVPEPFKNMQNLAHFEHFGSNRVGNPFGPQFVGAYTLNVETHVSQDP